MRENGGGWPPGPQPPQPPRMPQGPPVPQGPRMPQDPRVPQRPPLPDRNAWRPDDRRGPLPTGPVPLPPGPVPLPPDPVRLPPEPVHHEPGYARPHPAQGRPDDSPWRRTQRLSEPEAPEAPEVTQWPPAQASTGDPYPRGHYGDPGPNDPNDPNDPGGGEYTEYTEYEDEYEVGRRFVPGFADPDPDEADADYDDYGPPGDQGSRRSRRQDARGRGGRRSRRRFRWIAPLAALLVIVIPLAVGGIYVYSFYMSKYHPADYSGDGTGSVVVQVTSGDTPTSLGPKLVKLGVVASSRAFVLAAEHSTNTSGLEPGFYGMHQHMQATLAYALLANPKNMVQIPVTIPEGWRLSQIVAWLGAKSGIPASKYQAALNHPASLGLPSYANGKVEGYLFPATYTVQPHETALGVLKGMVQRFVQEAASVNLQAAAKKVGLTPGQVIIMASLVQAEGGRLSDYPKIARVIYNRLAQGIPLQLDSTVLYGLNTFGIIASDQQLNSPSPYNTYKHTGLPPGPIDSPGNAAIQAVLHPAPASDNWVYFVTVNPKTGETLFTSSEAQFEQFRQELQHNLAKG